MSEVRGIDEVAPAGGASRDSVAASEVLDKTQVILGYQEHSGKEGDYLTIDAEVHGNSVVWRTSGTTVLEQLRKVMDKGAFPVSAVLRQETSQNGRKFLLLRSPDSAGPGQTAVIGGDSKSRIDQVAALMDAASLTPADIGDFCRNVSEGEADKVLQLSGPQFKKLIELLEDYKRSKDDDVPF